MNFNPPTDQLTKWKPGQSGNPLGKPRGALRVSTILKYMLEEDAPGVVIDEQFIKEFAKGKKRVTNADATACRILYEGIVNGKEWALKEIADRTEGKAVQAIEVKDVTADSVADRIIERLIEKGWDEGAARMEVGKAYGIEVEAKLLGEGVVE